jgi:CIC family chloride channel protein
MTTPVNHHAQTLVKKLRAVFDLESAGRLILYSPMVGVVAGLGAALFFFLLTELQAFALGYVEGYYPPPAGSEPAPRVKQLPTYWPAVLLVPAVGGLGCGLLVYTFAPEAEGHGTDAMVRAFHRLKGEVRGRVPIIKTLASIMTIGTGGSAGREGPIAQIGAGFGSFLANRLGLSDRERRLLMLAGGAGGIGAIFQAPLGGALFVSEVLYASAAVEFEVFIPAITSSIIAYTVFLAIFRPEFGQEFAFRTPPMLEFHGIQELPFYLALALLCSVAGFVYVRFFYGLRDGFKRLPIPNAFKPALGGLALGAIALMLPQVMSGGYGWIQEAIDGKLTWQIMATLVLAKIAATSFTISSGGSGGVFAPSLFVGAMLGGAFGQLCHLWFPGFIAQPAAFVLVGMGGFFAGVAKVPLTAILMVCEMSGSYGLFVPLMLVSIANVALLSSRCSIYEEQVHSLIDSPAHLGDFVFDVLERIRVREVFRPDRKLDLVAQDMPLPQILRLVAHSKNSYFPVVDGDREMVGIFSLSDVRSALLGNRAGALIVAADLATERVLTVQPEDDLHTALRRFTQKNIDEIPVVDPEDPRKVLGMLSRKEVIGAYDQQLADLRNQG